jgi:hypothetical protein
MKRLIIALTASLAFSAQAQYVNGNMLLQKMNSTSWTEVGFAQGYVTGVADSYDGELFCLPPQVNVGQLVDLAKSYIVRNVKDRHRHAGALVAIAFVDVFPCKKGGGV